MNERQTYENKLLSLPKEIFFHILSFLDVIHLVRLLRVSKEIKGIIIDSPTFMKTKEEGRVVSCRDSTLKILPRDTKIGYKAKSSTIDTPQKMFSEVTREKVKRDLKSKSLNLTYKEAQINVYRHLSLEDRQKIRAEQKKLLKQQEEDLNSYYKISNSK